MHYVIIATLSFALSLIFIKLNGRTTSYALNTVIFTGTALLVQILALWATGKPKIQTLEIENWVFILIGGTALGIYTLSLYLALSKISISHVTPVVYAGGITLTTVVGHFFFKEPISILTIVGLVLVVTGLLMIIR